MNVTNETLNSVISNPDDMSDAIKESEAGWPLINSILSRIATGSDDTLTMASEAASLRITLRGMGDNYCLKLFEDNKQGKT